jgi:hypothetical protein
MTREPDGDYYFGYEPDSEECAWMIAQEKEIASLRWKYHEATRELRAYQKYTDRQLRGLNKEKKTTAHYLSGRFYFRVADDSFEVEIADDVFVSVPWPYDEEGGEDLGDEAPSPTRKDKRRAKTERRRAEQYLRFRRAQWEKSRAAAMVRKTGALSPVVAGMCHA